MRPEHVEHARLIVAWGNNVTWSNLHLMPIINRARKHGATLVVVDVRRTKIAEQADLHVALRPGTDVVLAWARVGPDDRVGPGGLRHAYHAAHQGVLDLPANEEPARHPAAARSHENGEHRAGRALALLPSDQTRFS